ncbi:MAG TPA: DUF2339 domain-containing protein [Rubrobacteraceae bacterium]|nr:DUF2339 domain-containing protein [Rubrobacteraceae bacterium]
MDGRKDTRLAERVEALEAAVERQGRELRNATRRLDSALGGQSPAGHGHPGSPDPAPTQRGGLSDVTRRFGGRSSKLPFDLERLRSGEWWLNKVGIGLLLFGAAFLFKFSVDQDWITPAIRVGIGLALGALLVMLGLRVYAERRSFSQVLLGGGIGVFYITGYAAFSMYALVTYTVAFAFMVMVTLMAFTLALRQNGAALALIGTLGGFGTPFLLYDGSGDVTGLVLYSSLILAGVGGIYPYKGWRSLLLASFLGAWTVLLIGADGLPYYSDAGREDRIALQLAVLFAWMVLWACAAGREVLRRRGLFRTDDPHDIHETNAVAHAVCVAAPLLALFFTHGIWNLQEHTVGWISLVAAALYSLAALLLHRVAEGGRMHYTHAATALVLATLAFALLLDGDALLVALAAEAAVLRYIARRLSDQWLSAGANALVALVLIWIFTRPLWDFSLLPGSGQVAVFNTRGLSDLAAIALVFVATLAGTPRRVMVLWRLAVHVALLAWLWRELGMIPGGEPYVTIAWGIYAAGLLIAGLRLDGAALMRTGMATLFLVVGKLFLFDLAGVEAVWRILLFLGFGGLFLALSYYLQSLWRPEPLKATRSPQVTARYPGGEELP